MRRLQKTIAEIGWTRDVPKLKASDAVSVAFAAMSREVHDCVLVVDGADALVGIFTSRDFLNRVAAVRADPAAHELGGVMTRTPRTLRPRDPVSFAINWMAVEGYRNVPIVDDLGGVLGVLTVWDVMRHLGEMFDEIDATPRLVAMREDSTINMLVDLGGDQ
jgi:CBS domain-containing protein